MIITDTAGKPKQLKRFLESQEGRDRVARALGPSLLPSGNSGKVLQLVGGMPTWCDVPQEQPAPAKGPLTLRCGACGTKHEANTKRCDACGCSNRMEDITGPKLEAIIQKRRDYFSAIRRVFRHIDIYPFSGGGTASTGPR